MDVDGNTTPCCTLRRRATMIAPLLSILQSPRKRLERVPISGVGETRTSTVSGAGDTSRCGATDSGKKNDCLRIIPVIMKGKDQHNTTVANVLLDPGLDITFCDASLMKKLQVDGHPKEFSLVIVNGASDTRKGFKLSLSV